MKVPSNVPALPKRHEIVELFRQRIQAGCRTKLKRSERQTLAKLFLDRLIQMAADETDSCDAIQRLCLDEIRLLEEGYPKNSLQSSYLPEYIKLLKDAIATRTLPLTARNSYPEKANDNGASCRHYALDFLSYNGQTQPLLAALEADTPPSADAPSRFNQEQYLALVHELFLSHDPIELIVGIVAATGRPSHEVLAFRQLGTTASGDFNRLTLQDDPYRLCFSASGETSSILTILPAADVLAAINKLRGHDLAALEASSLEDALEEPVHRLFESIRGITPALGTLRNLYDVIAREASFLEDSVPEEADNGAAQELASEGAGTAELPEKMSPDRTATLIATLQNTTKRQAQTIVTLTEVINRLHEELAVARRGQSEADAYRLKLENIHSVLNTAVQDGLLNARSRRKRQGRPSTTGPSMAYQRAVRVWKLTQQWNRERDYKSDAAIQLSKSLLTRHFGVHVKAINCFWDDFEAEIAVENQRLGLKHADIHFNKGEKQDIFVAHVKPILEQEGFSANAVVKPPRSCHSDQG